MSKAILNIPVRAVFMDLIEPGGAAGFTPNFSITGQVDKAAPEMRELLEQMQVVAVETWGPELAQTNLAAIQVALDNGVERRFAPSPIQDGDLDQPEYNAGTWVIKFSRRIDQGAPPLFGIDGQPIVDIANAPKQGDGCIVAVNVWAMKKHSRINFTVEGVRVAITGARIGGPPPAVIAAGLADLSSLALPSQIPGVQPAPQLGSGNGGVAPAAVPQTQQTAPPVVQEPQQEIVAPEASQGAPAGAGALFRAPTPETAADLRVVGGEETQAEVENVEPPAAPAAGPTMFDLG